MEKIKNSDTVYVYFKRDKNQFSNSNNNIKPDDLNYYYVFGYNGKYQLAMTFMHHYQVAPQEIKVKKSFLKKKKDVIITYEFLTKYNLAEATELIGNKKQVYLIDEDDIGWFSLKLKEVKVIGTVPQSIE
ncbi:hypothetical protein ACQ9BO_22175 [Flavobacterium sp. P21]|uniref:hypothetical protein n=1 Tax=Flavobacterium sp. P21 TaxID=3423948 RepID=UPI003D66F6AB